LHVALKGNALCGVNKHVGIVKMDIAGTFETINLIDAD
jgi:hypothetical protein